MQLESTSDRSIVKVNTSVARRVRLSRLRRAHLGQWQALGYLVVFVGLFAGLFMTHGFSPLISLVPGMVVLAPVLLSTVSARVGRYRLASVFGMLGVLLDAGLALTLLVAVFDGYPLLEQLVRVVEAIAAAGMLAGAGIATFDAALVLWSASGEPPRLGPGAVAPMLDAPAAAAGTPEDQGGGSQRQLRAIWRVRCDVTIASGSSLLRPSRWLRADLAARE